MKKISILGCGWLGFPLAKVLLENGYFVKGSTTSTEKLPLLQSAGIEPFLIILTPALSKGEGEETIEDYLNESKILIIDIPPKLRGDSKESFVQKIEDLIPFIEKSGIENVLFISSTSVYTDDNSTITEQTLPQPDSESGKQLLQAEQLLQNNSHFKTTVLRFGGLIGEDRHPVYFLSGKEQLDNPEAPINLIHQKDCMGIILKIIASNCWGETFNAVAPFHPSRKTYYTQKAAELNLKLPNFNVKSPSIGKTILSDKVESVLGYRFVKATL